MKKYLTLVNKENQIKNNYLKNIKLVNIKLADNTPCQLEEITYQNYLLLKKELANKKIDISLASTYRTVEDQQAIWEEYKEKYGLEYVEKYVAIPKTSEHHTGLAIDLALKVNGKYTWDNDELLQQEDIFKKIHKILPEYGFILRYPKGKEEITGYQYEPWHIRYVGKIPAKIMYENHWTLEEYITKFSGILYINKEVGKTSFDIVNEISNIFGIQKVGHTGTLDPLAEGVLIVTLGKAVKVAELITAEDKEYIAGILLGVETDTLDITGNVIKSKPVDISKDLEQVVNSYKKTYMQEVPVFSAIKVNGKKLYEYARENKPVELPKKEVTIKEIKLLSSDNDTFVIKAKVTKGCYIRSLIRDIGRSLGIYATMTALTRTKQGKIDIKDTNTLEEINQGKYKLHKIEEVLDLPVIEVNKTLEKKIKNGQKLLNTYHIKDKVIFKNEKKEILGIYKVEKDKLRVWKNF